MFNDKWGVLILFMKGMLSEEGQRRNFPKGRELKGVKNSSMSPVMLSGN